VKRRQHTIGPSVPEALCRFVPSEWAGAEDPFRAWSVARLEIAKEYDDTPIGDPVDVLRENYLTKRRMLARGEL
jgi:hypothetical protein